MRHRIWLKFLLQFRSGWCIKWIHHIVWFIYFVVVVVGMLLWLTQFTLFHWMNSWNLHFDVIEIFLAFEFLYTIFHTPYFWCQSETSFHIFEYDFFRLKKRPSEDLKKTVDPLWTLVICNAITCGLVLLISSSHSEIAFLSLLC